MTELVMGLGIACGIIFQELAGVSPGGVIAPAYLALYLDQPGRVVSTLVVSLLAYGAVAIGGRSLLLYGRRRTGATILVGFVLRWAWEGAALSAWPGLGLDAIGFLVPGLIAVECDRQGVISTWSGLLIVASVVRLAVLTLRGFAWL